MYFTGHLFSWPIYCRSIGKNTVLWHMLKLKNISQLFAHCWWNSKGYYSKPPSLKRNSGSIPTYSGSDGLLLVLIWCHHQHSHRQFSVPVLVQGCDVLPSFCFAYWLLFCFIQSILPVFSLILPSFPRTYNVLMSNECVDIWMQECNVISKSPPIACEVTWHDSQPFQIV